MYLLHSQSWGVIFDFHESLLRLMKPRIQVSGSRIRGNGGCSSAITLTNSVNTVRIRVIKCFHRIFSDKEDLPLDRNMIAVNEFRMLFSSKHHQFGTGFWLVNLDVLGVLDLDAFLFACWNSSP